MLIEKTTAKILQKLQSIIGQLILRPFLIIILEESEESIGLIVRLKSADYW